jgi:formylmethanofuran dehydrogenase subunit E
MRTMAEYEQMAAAAHGHLCAGQILGLRMAIHGLELLSIEDPEGRDRKRLVTFIEIDRCATDAIPVVTGCRLGKRALKFRDFGKMAATFCDLRSDRAVRLAARESAKVRARELFPEMENKNLQQMAAYRVMRADELFDWRWVQVKQNAEDFPGYKGERRNCAECGEGISFERHVLRDRKILCRSCAGESYYRNL